MQKVNNCFNIKRQEHAREKVFNVKDGQVQKSDERPGVSDHARVGGGEAREMGGRTKMESKSGNLDRVNGRRDLRSSKCNDNAWQLEREVVKDRLHVSGIAPEVCEQELGDFFSTFGRCVALSFVEIYLTQGEPCGHYPCSWFRTEETKIWICHLLQWGSCSALHTQGTPHVLNVLQVLPKLVIIYQQQSQRGSMVLRGYKLHVSPARERRHEVLERRQVEVIISVQSCSLQL